jgi:transcriptional regulator with XRE-family HTH domain
MVTAPQPGPAAKLPAGQCAVAAANIRALRQRNGWTQARLGQLMGWPAASTVCAAEGHRGGRQRRFARWEIDQLAAIFGIPTAQLLSRCVTCGGQPPPGYACLACKAARPERPARPAATSPPLPAEGQREKPAAAPAT